MGGAIAAALATRYSVFRTGMVLHSPCARLNLSRFCVLQLLPLKCRPSRKLPFCRLRMMVMSTKVLRQLLVADACDR